MIASLTNLSIGTVRNNISRLMQKMGLKKRIFLAIYAYGHHLVSAEEAFGFIAEQGSVSRSVIRG
jgi:hypothetical protein